MDLGPHAIFIWSSYGAAALVFVALIGWLLIDGRRHRQALEMLESRGVRRRSAGEARNDGEPTHGGSQV